MNWSESRQAFQLEETMKRFLTKILEIRKQHAPGSAKELKVMVKDYPHDKQGIYVYQFCDFADLLTVNLFCFVLVMLRKT